MFGRNLNYIFKMYGDAWTVMGVLDAAVEHSGPTFLYNFDYHTNFSLCSLYIGNPLVTGPCHFDELLMLFPMGGHSPEVNVADPLYQLSVIMVEMWTNFAKYGNPTPYNKEVSWHNVQSDALEYFKISNEGMFMQKYPLQDRYNLWRRLPVIN